MEFHVENGNLFKMGGARYEHHSHVLTSREPLRREWLIQKMPCTAVCTGVKTLRDQVPSKENPRNQWIEDLIGSYIGFVEELLPYGHLMSQIAFYSYELLRQTDYSDPQTIIGLAIDEFLKDEELDEEMALFLPNLLEILLDEIKRLVQLKRMDVERWEVILAEKLEKKTWFGHSSGMHDLYYT